MFDEWVLKAAQHVFHFRDFCMRYGILYSAALPVVSVIALCLIPPPKRAPRAEATTQKCR
ncbi:MAG: hypothetical protein ACIAQU_04435 [Phycisphaerales bacterium JB064]